MRPSSQGQRAAVDDGGVVVEPERAQLTVPGLGSVTVLVARAVPGARRSPVFAEHPPAPARMLHRRQVRIAPVPPVPSAERRAMLLAVPDSRGTLRADVVHAVFEDPLEELQAADTAGTPHRRPHLRAAGRGASTTRGRVVGVQALTQDLSVDGIGLRGAVELSRGDIVRLRIALEHAEPVDAIAEVRRAVGADARGLQLVRMRAADRVRLQQWLTERRAAALAALSG